MQKVLGSCSALSLKHIFCPQPFIDLILALPLDLNVVIISSTKSTLTFSVDYVLWIMIECNFIKTPRKLFVGINKQILKFIQKSKRPRLANSTLKKRTH